MGCLDWEVVGRLMVRVGKRAVFRIALAGVALALVFAPTPSYIGGPYLDYTGGCSRVGHFVVCLAGAPIWWGR